MSVLHCVTRPAINRRAQKLKPGQPGSKRDRDDNRQAASAVFVKLARGFSSGLWLVVLLLAATALCDQAEESHKEFRVCADPNNLPFSNRKQEGFENKIAELLAHEFGGHVTYAWWPQRRGFIRNTLNAGLCDVVMGVPAGYDPVLTTRPYYRSTYVFVYPQSAGYRIASFDDPLLQKLKIGVHLIGDDYANSPPAHALGEKGIVKNVVGYSVFGDYAEDSPPGKIIAAVAAGEVDVAIVWGPIAGYFARKQAVPLTLVPVPADAGSSSLPFTYSIALGVRRKDAELKAKLDEALSRKATEVGKILQDYGVPLVQD
ncbi:MAG TPA: substrate-binding domain-containing protein [Candidatus Binatia bacterium]|nr:substrate-binding domain-containing protein [Candidatus Binatia bacterium]